MELYQGDFLEIMRGFPDKSVDLVLTDPPYNIGVTTKHQGHSRVNSWDRIDNYIDWSISWLTECQRVLKENGVLYFWQNDISKIAELLVEIKKRTSFQLVSFCIWDKGDSYRAKTWLNRDPESETALRNWFNICEYCLHFFNAPQNADKAWKQTGLARINSNPECYRPLKEWYAAEKERLGLTNQDIAHSYQEAIGRKPYMLRHYFQDSQFEIPTQKVWESVYMPLGFSKAYESLREQYESLRPVHRCDAKHCNVWHVPPVSSVNRLHTCQKPVELLERIIKVSSRPGGTVLDCFMGSGSTGAACISTGRAFIGIEQDPSYFQSAKARLNALQSDPEQMSL